jgi:hypothetical protein
MAQSQAIRESLSGFRAGDALTKASFFRVAKEVDHVL